jgi:hypothetical protein
MVVMMKMLRYWMSRLPHERSETKSSRSKHRGKMSKIEIGEAEDRSFPPAIGPLSWGRRDGAEGWGRRAESRLMTWTWRRRYLVWVRGVHRVPNRFRRTFLIRQRMVPVVGPGSIRCYGAGSTRPFGALSVLRKT